MDISLQEISVYIKQTRCKGRWTEGIHVSINRDVCDANFVEPGTSPDLHAGEKDRSPSAGSRKAVLKLTLILGGLWT
jgi:hypothetical protein